MKVKFINLVVLCFSFYIANAQKSVKEAETMAKSEFKKMHKHEIDELKMTEKQYIQMKLEDFNNFQKYKQLSSNLKAANNICDNGDFNRDITPTDWIYNWKGSTFGGYATAAGVNMANSGSFLATNNHSTEIHHVRVSRGQDQNAAPLYTTDSPTNNYSLRLGNMGIGRGYESVTKKILVSSSNSILKFSYAMVVRHPNDNSHNNAFPGFGVNISYGTQNLNNLVNLGNGANTITSENPMLLNVGNNTTGPIVKYKMWSCVTVDLSSQIGKEIEIEFFNRDCLLGAHWGYSYIDNICVGCQGPDPEGSVTLNISKTDSCGTGKICVKYTVPEAPNPSMIISLNLTQNSDIKKTLNSPNLTTNGEYCFTISNADLALMNNSIGGFDFHVIAKPKSGSFVFPSKTEGNLSQGIRQNVIDYKLNCKPVPPPVSYSPCCPPINKEDIKQMFNPVFQSGASGPYKMIFNPTQQFKNLMQAYINLLNLTCSSKNLNFAWQLCDMGNGNQPGSGYCNNAIEQKYTSVTVGGNGSFVPSTNFFNSPNSICQPNRWYRITLGIYPDTDKKCFDLKCSDSLVMDFRWQMMTGKTNQQPVLEILGHNSIPIKSSK